MANSIKIGNSAMDSIYIGATQADAVYIGANKVYEKTQPTPTYPIIQFADQEVEAICVDNWDLNGDDHIDTNEAAQVTTLNDVFDSNTDITSFRELRYFTGLSEIGWAEFDSCESLETIDIPANVTNIGSNSSIAFGSCTSLQSVYMWPTTPPTILAREFEDSPDIVIYVPTGSLSEYQYATNWSNFNIQTWNPPTI